MSLEYSPGHLYSRRLSDKEKPRRRYRRIDKKQEQQEDDSPQEYKIPLGKVVVLYDGTLSQKLDWGQDKLDKFARKSDLNMTVRVRSSDSMQSGSYDSLGEVAIWKKIGNPLDLFRRQLRDERKSSVVGNPQTWEVDAVLHDQEISKDVRENNRGKFVEQQFVHKINLEAKKSLSDALAYEKKRLIYGASLRRAFFSAIAGIGAGTLAIEAGLGLGASYEAFRLFKSAVENLASSSNVPYSGSFKDITVNAIKDYLGAAVQFGKIGASFIVATVGAGFFHIIPGTLKTFREFITEDPINILDDSSNNNPTKHIRKWVNGWVYLQTGGRRIVKLKEDEQKALDN